MMLNDRVWSWRAVRLVDTVGITFAEEWPSDDERKVIGYSKDHAYRVKMLEGVARWK